MQNTTIEFRRSEPPGNGEVFIQNVTITHVGEKNCFESSRILKVAFPADIRNCN